MATFSAYTDVTTLLNEAVLNVETATLVTGNSTLAASCVAGATSLTVGSSSNFPTSGTFVLWILDGPNSESISGVTYAANVLTLPSPGTTYAHAAGVSVSSAGSQGSLAALIARASSWVDAICRQGPDAGTDRTLWRKSRTEVLSGPAGPFPRARFDADRQLTLAPYHFPVTSTTSVTVQMGAQSVITIDLTYLVLPDNARVITIPSAQALGAQPTTVTWRNYPFPRNVPFVANLTYTAGPISGTTVDSVPFDIREATYLLVADLLSRRQNPLGVAMSHRGDTTYEMYLRGDTSAKSSHRKRAEEMLLPYTAQMYGG